MKPYLAEIGRAVFYSSMAIGAATALLEYFAPGVVGNYVTTQHLAAFMALGLALAMLEPQQAATIRRPWLILMLAALAAGAFAWQASARYLEKLPEVARWAVPAATGAILLGAGAFTRTRRKGE